MMCNKETSLCKHASQCAAKKHCVRRVAIRRPVKEVFAVATSSITKQFVVKDQKAFERLVAESEKLPDRKATKDSSSLNKGRELLSRFSLR